jgi:hypothetical protein
MRVSFNLLTAVLFIGVVAGCSKGGVPTIPVHGKITFAGGPPPAAGTVTFAPLTAEEGLPRRGGTGHFDTTGEFSTTSFQPNDGLIPGTYRPIIACWMGNPSSGDPSSFERLNYVPSNFQAQEVKVDSGKGNVEVAIDVPKKK